MWVAPAENPSSVLGLRFEKVPMAAETLQAQANRMIERKQRQKTE
jgi:hypothetical protein